MGEKVGKFEDLEVWKEGTRRKLAKRAGSQYRCLKNVLTLLYICHYNATSMKYNGG